MAVNGTRLTDTELRKLTRPPVSTPFDPDTRLYRSFEDFGRVYEWPDLDLRGVREMLGKDGNPRKLEQVLTLPIRGAGHEITGGGPARDLVMESLAPRLGAVIDSCTSGFSYRKAFFETTWALDGGRVVYDEIAPRPATSCEAAYRDKDGSPDGFRQQLAPITTFARGGSLEGWVDIPQVRSFIYVHGRHREPLHGVSDLDVCLYCWDNIRKIQFLWCQFLEQQSLPKLVVWGNDDTEAQRNAENVAAANASATIPMRRLDDPSRRATEVIESSGRGAAQFHEALRYWESKQTQSVLASFMDLAEAAASGLGSYALSADQSEFFLASRQAVADEMAQQITEKLIAPLVVYNYGPDVEVPALRIGPIGNRQTDRALALLEKVVTAPTLNAPPEFVGILLEHTAAFLGLDSGEVEAAVARWAAEQQAAGTDPEPAAGEDPAEPERAADMARATDFAAQLVARTLAGADPADALRDLAAAA